MAPERKFVVKFVVQPILSNVISLSIYETGLKITMKRISSNILLFQGIWKNSFVNNKKTICNS